MVVKESFKLYKAISEGVINLADAFFELDYLVAGAQWWGWGACAGRKGGRRGGPSRLLTALAHARRSARLL
jgi:hypothetical protein